MNINFKILHIGLRLESGVAKWTGLITSYLCKNYKTSSGVYMIYKKRPLSAGMMNYEAYAVCIFLSLFSPGEIFSLSFWACPLSFGVDIQVDTLFSPNSGSTTFFMAEQWPFVCSAGSVMTVYIYIYIYPTDATKPGTYSRQPEARALY